VPVPERPAATFDFVVVDAVVIPGTAIGLGVVWVIGVRGEQQLD
jgi:hypothetical protein